LLILKLKFNLETNVFSVFVDINIRIYQQYHNAWDLAFVNKTNKIHN